MKKFLLCVSAAIVALASCSKTEVQEINGPQEIGFKAINSIATKAGSFTLDQLNDGSMGVFANQAGTSTTYFGNTSFEKKTTSGTGQNYWTGGQYWPNSGSLDFVFYAPYLSSGVTIANAKSAGIVLTATNVPADKDFLYGTQVIHAAKQKTAVKTTLAHAKAKVCFNAQASVAGVYKIKSVTLNTHNTVGTAKVTYATQSTKENPAAVSTVEWTSIATDTQTLTPNDEGGLALTTGATAIVNGPAKAPATENENGLFVIPGNQSSFTIAYTMNGQKCDDVTFTLGGTWDKGKKYTYNITFTADEIFFNPDVQDWESELEEDFNHPEEKMSFTAAEAGAKPGENAIGVQAWTNTDQLYFMNAEGTKSGEGWVTSYNWPVKESNAMTSDFGFMAYAPYSGQAVTEGHSENNEVDASTKGFIDIYNVTPTNDLIFATQAASTKGKTTPVSLDFNHAKAKVIIKIIPEGAINEKETYTVQRVTFENLALEGDVKLRNGTNDCDWTTKLDEGGQKPKVSNVAWSSFTPDTGEGSATQITQAAHQALFAGIKQSPLFVIPKNYPIGGADAVKPAEWALKVTYTYNNGEGGGTQQFSEQVVTPASAEFRANNEYTITITLLKAGSPSAAAIAPGAEWK